MAINFRNRLIGCTITNDEVGTVDVFPYLDLGGSARSPARDKQPLVWTGELRFFQPEGDTPRIELDNRLNPLWKKGGIVQLTGRRLSDNSSVDFFPLVLNRHTILLEGEEDGIFDVQEISIQVGDYLHEMNGQNQSQIVNSTALSAANLAKRVLEIGAGDRNLNIDVSGISQRLLLGFYTLNENQSASGMAAEIAYPDRRWFWVKPNGDITTSQYPLCNDTQKEPVQRIALVDADRARRVTPNRDLPTRGVAGGTGKEVVQDPYPRQSREYINRPANTLYPDPGIGPGFIQASAKETLIEFSGRRETLLTKPLMSWGSLARTEAPITPGENVQLRTQYTVTFIDGIKQYNSDGNLVVEESTKQGIAGAFRTNYQDTISNVGDKYLTVVKLKTRREIQYVSGLPLIQRTETDYLADEDINGSVNEDNATLDILTDVLTETWTETPIGSGLYVREYQQVKRGASGEDLPAGPPQIERRPRPGEIKDTLFVETYEPDTSAINEGVPKNVSASFDYATSRQQATEIAQLIFERSVSQYYARQISIPMPDWVWDLEDAFPRIDFGQYSYIVSRIGISWDRNFNLYCTLQLDEIGELPLPVQPRASQQSAWPIGLPTVAGPIQDPDGNCDGPLPPVTPEEMPLIIDPIPDISEAVGVAINPIPLSAIGGTPPYSFSAPGGLPANISISGSNLIIGSGAAVMAPVPYIIQVTDAALDTAVTNFNIEFTAVQPYTFPVPLQIDLSVGTASGTEVIALPYDTTPAPIGVDAGTVSGATVSVTLNVQAGTVSGIQVIAAINVDVGTVSGAEVTKGAVTLTAGTVSGVETDDLLNPYQIEHFFENGHPEYEF